MRRSAVVLVVGLCACADESLSPGAPPGEACPPPSYGLDVTPDVLRRDEPVALDIAWRVGGELEPPAVALLEIGEAASIQVEVPLAPTDDPEVWRAVQDNPFGMGAPAGFVSVLVRARGGYGCDRQASAAASFVLE